MSRSAILLIIIRYSVQFNFSVGSDSLQPYWLHHARLPCPSPAHGVYSNSCASSQWCHPSISFSVIPFSSCLQSFPASQWASSSHQVAKVLELQHQSFQSFPLRIDWLDLLQSKRVPRVFSNTTVQRQSAFLHPYMTTGKTIALTRQTFVGKV